MSWPLTNTQCLSGSPPTFDISRNETSDQWVLFLEGGGWCYGDTANATKQSCARRGGMNWPPNSVDSAMSAYPVASSNGADIGGVMSNDPHLNPDFYTWNKVIICMSYNDIVNTIFWVLHA